MPTHNAEGPLNVQELMSNHGVVFSMSRSANVWDNAAMESRTFSAGLSTRSSDGWRPPSMARAIYEAKFMLPWAFSEEFAAEKYMAQLQHLLGPIRRR